MFAMNDECVSINCFLFLVSHFIHRSKSHGIANHQNTNSNFEWHTEIYQNDSEFWNPKRQSNEQNRR